MDPVVGLGRIGLLILLNESNECSPLDFDGLSSLVVESDNEVEEVGFPQVGGRLFLVMGPRESDTLESGGIVQHEARGVHGPGMGGGSRVVPMHGSMMVMVVQLRRVRMVSGGDMERRCYVMRSGVALFGLESWRGHTTWPSGLVVEASRGVVRQRYAEHTRNAISHRRFADCRLETRDTSDFRLTGLLYCMPVSPADHNRDFESDW